MSISRINHSGARGLKYFHVDSGVSVCDLSCIGGHIILRKLLLEERGTETVEWGLLAGLVVGGVILVLIAVSLWVKSRFDGLQTELEA